MFVASTLLASFVLTLTIRSYFRARADWYANSSGGGGISSSRGVWLLWTAAALQVSDPGGKIERFSDIGDPTDLTATLPERTKLPLLTLQWGISADGTYHREILVSGWLIVALLLLMGVIGFQFSFKAPQPGTCIRCGYDLRATPGRCPECGAISRVEVNSPVR